VTSKPDPNDVDAVVWLPDDFVDLVSNGNWEAMELNSMLLNRHPEKIFAAEAFADPNDSEDMKDVHALQTQIKVEQANKGNFQIPNWDQKSLESSASADRANQGTNRFRQSLACCCTPQPIHDCSPQVDFGNRPRDNQVEIPVI